jgi:hypothetical protein
MDQNKGLRNAAYLCQKLAIFGGVLWVINVVIFFFQYFSTGMQWPNFRAFVEGYGGGIIAAIIPILLLYAAGGVINLLLKIEENTRK